MIGWIWWISLKWTVIYTDQHFKIWFWNHRWTSRRMEGQSVEKETVLLNLVEAEIWPEHVWLQIKCYWWCQQSNFLGTADPETCSDHLLRVIRPNNWLFLTLGADNRPWRTFRAAFCVVFPDETSESWMNEWGWCSCVWQRNNKSFMALWTSMSCVNTAAAVTHTTLCHLLPLHHLCHEDKIPADVGAWKHRRVAGCRRREDANISWASADWPTLHLQ